MVAEKVSGVCTEWEEWATPKQVEYIRAYLKEGSFGKAGKALGIDSKTVYRGLLFARKKAIRHGWSPEHDMVHTCPEGLRVKGTSTLYDRDGNISLQWVKTTLDDEQTLFLETVKVLCEEFKGKSKIRPEPRGTVRHLLTTYPIADPHHGLYAWAEEAGEDYNIQIAEDALVGCFERLVASAPPSQRALIAILGDMFHCDDNSNETKRAGNKLDTDTRWALVLRSALSIVIRTIGLALLKHKQVDIIIDIGNHDDNSAYALALALDAYYRNDPRVNIDLSPSKFHFYRFGKVLIGTTHGDTVKQKDLAEILANARPQDWGETTHRYFFTGHEHHQSVLELRGCKAMGFGTISARSFWEATKGYYSQRELRYMVFHNKFGEVEQHTVSIDQVFG